MKDKIRYSIITPQFNSFELMDNYFESMEKQRFKQFEIIIVDDCSTDGSYEKLQQYIKCSSLSISLFQSEKNSGPGNARNIGISNASGEWITFVDNDDWVDEFFLEKIDKIINQENVNCVICDYYTWNEGSTKIAHSMYINSPGYKTVSECMVSARNHTFGKFYKLSKCCDVRFPVVRRCEDVAYVMQAIASCESVFYYNMPLYYYRQRPSSLSNNSKMDHSDMVRAFEILENKFSVDYPIEIANKSITDLLYGALLMMCKSGNNKLSIIKYIIEYEKKYPNWWNCEILNHLGIAKNIFLLFAKWHFVEGLKVLAFAHSLKIRKGA